MERFYRDNRLNAIHEGTHGIQGLDLLGRKVSMQGGAAFDALYEEYAKTIEAAGDVAELAEFRESFMAATSILRETTAILVQVNSDGETNRALANASTYLDTFGHVVIGWIWLREATLAARALSKAQGSDVDFYAGKMPRLPVFLSLRDA